MQADPELSRTVLVTTKVRWKELQSVFGLEHNVRNIFVHSYSGVNKVYFYIIILNFVIFSCLLSLILSSPSSAHQKILRTF